MPRFLSSMPEMMERGMRGPAVAGRRALALRLGSVAVFVAAWSLASGIVVLAQLFNPIFLPGPWMVIGNIVELAVLHEAPGRGRPDPGEVEVEDRGPVARGDAPSPEAL